MHGIAAADAESHQVRSWAQAAAVAQTRNDGRIPLYHGASVNSAISLHNKAALSLETAAGLQHDRRSTLGFHLT